MPLDKITSFFRCVVFNPNIKPFPYLIRISIIIIRIQSVHPPTLAFERVAVLPQSLMVFLAAQDAPEVILSRHKSYLVIKAKEVKIVNEVKRFHLWQCFLPI